MERNAARSVGQPVNTGYLRGVLDTTGRLVSPSGPGYLTDYWRNVIKTLCDRVDELEAERGE